MKTNQKGFGAIGMILATIAVLIVVAIGWIVLGSDKTTKEANDIISSINPAGPNLTGGWKAECLSPLGLCIKHPNDWSLRLSSDSGFTLSSPDKKAFVQVSAAAQTTTPTYYGEKFYLTTQDHIYTPNLPYKVIGGYTVGEVNNSPSYMVVDSGYEGQVLKLNTVANISTPALFGYMHNNESLIEATVKMLPVSLPANATSQQSTTWLSSPTAQTGLQILKSITTK